MKILTFTLDESKYGILTEAVSEIVRSVSLVNLPGTPDVVEGVFSLRGRTVPVVNVRKRFGVSSRPLSPDDHFILVHLHGNLVGLHVDNAEDIIDLTEDKIESLKKTVAESEGVKGVVAAEEGMLVIYDVDAFLTASEVEAVAKTIQANEEQTAV